MKLPAWFGGALLLFFGTAVAANDEPIPPNVTMTTNLSCNIKQEGSSWHTIAVAEYANPTKYHGGKPWEMELSVRKNLKASAEDCDKWLKAVKRAYAQATKSQAEVPHPESGVQKP